MNYKTVFTINEECDCGNKKTISCNVFHKMGATTEDLERAKQTGIASGSAIDGKYQRCWNCQKAIIKQEKYENRIMKGLEHLNQTNPAPENQEWTIAYAPISVVSGDITSTILQPSYVLIAK